MAAAGSPATSRPRPGRRSLAPSWCPRRQAARSVAGRRATAARRPLRAHQCTRAQQRVPMRGPGRGTQRPPGLPAQKEYTPSAAIARRLPSKWPRPSWHAPWRMYRVISGHLG